jgi:hypothetical protein
LSFARNLPAVGSGNPFLNADCELYILQCEKITFNAGDYNSK